jgi:hypothetical protein
MKSKQIILLALIILSLSSCVKIEEIIEDCSDAEKPVLTVKFVQQTLGERFQYPASANLVKNEDGVIIPPDYIVDEVGTSIFKAYNKKGNCVSAPTTFGVTFSEAESPCSNSEGYVKVSGLVSSYYNYYDSYLGSEKKYSYYNSNYERLDIRSLSNLKPGYVYKLVTTPLKEDEASVTMEYAGKNFYSQSGSTLYVINRYGTSYIRLCTANFKDANNKSYTVNASLSYVQ